MTNILQRSAQWLADVTLDGVTAQSESAAVAIVYRRGTSSVAMQATVAMQRGDLEDTDGVITSATVREYSVRAADLVLNGLHVRPLPGDLIEEVIGGRTETYVVAPAPGVKEHEPADAHWTMLLIRTKRIG